MDIKEARNKIDKIDNDILQLLARRFDLLPDILNYKLENGLPILDSGRESMVIDEKKAKAIDVGLDSEFIAELFKNIMEEPKRLQQIYLKERINNE